MQLMPPLSSGVLLPSGPTILDKILNSLGGPWVGIYAAEKRRLKDQYLSRWTKNQNVSIVLYVQALPVTKRNAENLPRQSPP